MSNNSRFNNLSLAAPAVPEPQLQLRAGVDVNPLAKEIADSEQAAVRSIMGMTIDEQAQWFRNGTKMLACGEATAMGLRQQFDDLPLMRDSLDTFIGLIKAEERKDYIAPLSGVRITDEGLITGINGSLLPTPQGQQTLASFGPKTMDSRLRQNVNLWASESPKTVKFRTRNPQEDGKRFHFATVSQKYSVFDADQVAQDLIDGGLPLDARGETKYDGHRWSFTSELAPTFKVEELGVGRVFRVLVKISGADDRSQGLRAEFQAKRIKCINCTTMTDKRLVFKRKHMGEIRGLFAQSMGAVETAMQEFSNLWAEANTEALVDKATGDGLSAEETFKRLIAHGYVSVPHVKKADLLSKLMGAFEEEPGSSSASIHNAITRLAHEGASGWASPWYMDDLEEQAGKLLFQRVLTLPGMTDQQAGLFA